MKTTIHFEKNWDETLKQLMLSLYFTKGVKYIVFGIDFICWDLYIMIDWTKDGK